MNSTRIATTPLIGLRALGTSGSRSYQRLFEVLSARLSADHAGLLAEPVPAPDGSKIDWYVAGGQRGVPMETLPEAARAQVQQRFDGIVSDITQLADKVTREGASGADLAAALRNAVTVPGPEHIYAVPVATEPQEGSPVYRPVLVAWSHSKDGLPGYEGGLEGRAKLIEPKRPAAKPVTAPPPVQPAPVPPPAEPVVYAHVTTARQPWNWSWLLYWLLWILFALIVLRIFWLLLWGCGLSFLGMNFCARGAMLPQVPSALVDVVSNLEGQIARRPICAPGVTPTQSPTPAQIERRVEEAGGKKGRLQFTLAWVSPADLDLAVICPSGETIDESSRGRLVCGATMQIDANRVRAPEFKMATPVEHIVWPLEGAAPPSGKFRIRVRYFGDNDDPTDPVPFQVVVADGERAPQIFQGTLPKRQGSAFPEAFFDYER